jgi:putative acetyltransferase
MDIRPLRQIRTPCVTRTLGAFRPRHHTFLTEADIVFYRPLVADIFAGDALDLWVLTDEANVPIGFLGLAGNAIEALFREPAHLGRGGGRRLVAHAQELRGGALTVDVNEQNAAARGFYEALGFDVVARSPLDETGRPYPILHMRRETPRREGTLDNRDVDRDSVRDIR